MKLSFARGKDWSSENITTVSKWNGVIVLLRTGQEGEVDVMFTGLSKNGKTLFAKVVDGLKVDARRGIRSSGSMCCEVGYGLDVDNVEVEFTPGLLHRWLYISHYNPTFPQFDKQALGGTYYLAMHKNSLKVIGVDSPCLFNAFSEKHNEYKPD